MKKILLLVACSFILVACGSGKKIKPGQIVVTNQQCLAARSESSFDELNRVCNRKDQTALKMMITNKEVYLLDDATTIKVTDLRFGTVIGEIRTGDHIFEPVYISREFVE